MTAETVPDLEALRLAENDAWRKLLRADPPRGFAGLADQHAKALEARVRHEEQTKWQALIEEQVDRGLVPALVSARADAAALRLAALELADAYDAWDQSACTFLHAHPHEPSDLVQNVRRAALRGGEGG